MNIVDVILQECDFRSQIAQMLKDGGGEIIITVRASEVIAEYCYGRREFNSPDDPEYLSLMANFKAIDYGGLKIEHRAGRPIVSKTRSFRSWLGKRVK